jgi:SAM-dependent methyltransferase
MSSADAVPVDHANRDQLRAWDGEEGAYWADHADYFDRSVAHYHRQLLEAASIASSERVLDIGCGTGQTTRDAARTAAEGEALGVDLSSRMLEYARLRAASEGVANASFEQADAQVHPFPPGSFDIAISRTGAMFFADPTAAFTNIARALRHAGRLALTAWQPLSANEWVREIGAALAAGRDMPAPTPNSPGPFSLSDPDHVRSMLSAAGFIGIEVESATAGMWFGSESDDAHRFVLGLMGWMLSGLDEAGRASAIDGLRATMSAHETAEGVVFGSAAWIIRATRA